MITRGHLWRFVLGGSAVVALAACQSSDRAGAPSPTVRPTEVTASTSPTASPSATPTATDEATAWARVPAPARAHTYAGAQAFAEFYVGQINKAWTTPDPELLRPYGLPSCKSCRAYADTAASLAKSGRRYDRDPGRVLSSAWQPGSGSDHVEVRVVAEQAESRVVDGRGRVTDKKVRRSFELAFTLAWGRSSWGVQEIKQVMVKTP